MEFLKKLIGRSEPSVFPTSDWVRDRQTKIEADLSRRSFCGVRLGEGIEPLQVLGPAEDAHEAFEDAYLYCTRGFELDVTDGRLCGITLVWQDALDDRFRPFDGTCTLQDQAVPLGPFVTVEQLVEMTGEPYWRDDDEDEVILFYAFREGDDWDEWQVEFERSGPTTRLQRWLMVRPPLMADPVQRERFGVDRSWPPPS